MKDTDIGTQTRQSNRVVFLLSISSAVLLWIAFPPVGFSVVSFLALTPLLTLVDRPEPISRRGYFLIWISGCVVWLALLQGIRLAYWPLYAGWIALSLYLAVYWPLFVGLSRVATVRLGMPMPISATIVWVGLECARGYALTGFSGCLLGHTLTDYPIMLQIADTLGAYGVSATIVLANSMLAVLWHDRFANLIRPPIAKQRNCKIRWVSLIGPSLVLGCVIGYGGFRIEQSKKLSDAPLARIALIQENSPTIFETTPERNLKAWMSYWNATSKAARKYEDIDLVVWPESVFTGNEPLMVLADGTDQVPSMWIDNFRDFADLNGYLGVLRDAFEVKIAKTQDEFRRLNPDSDVPRLLLGQDNIVITNEDLNRYNSAVLVGPDGNVETVYAKTHLVMFGEYIPFGDWLPFIYSSFKMSPIRTKNEVVAFPIGKATVAPSICFENMLPHWLHWQQQELEKQSNPSDVLVTITNDGWFRGSSMLDHHLNCGILAAVENRQPMLIAANTGLSAWVDGSGRKVAVTQRLTADSILAEPTADGRYGLWQSIGDWPARICGLVCLILAVLGWRKPATLAEKTS